MAHPGLGSTSRVRLLRSENRTTLLSRQPLHHHSHLALRSCPRLILSAPVKQPVLPPSASGSALRVARLGLRSANSHPWPRTVRLPLVRVRLWHPLHLGNLKMGQFRVAHPHSISHCRSGLGPRHPPRLQTPSASRAHHPSQPRQAPLDSLLANSRQLKRNHQPLCLRFRSQGHHSHPEVRCSA